MAAEPGEFKVPAPEDEACLWSLIETAWAPLGPEIRQARQELAVRLAGSRADISAVAGELRAFLRILAGRCRGLPAATLTSLDRALERKLLEIDRAGIHAVTGGSDDGFLYSRGFIVVMGREFYDAVARNRGIGVPYAGCEEMCYFFAHLYRERFGDFPGTGSGISRESGSNPSGWTC
jgi:hypothetical protein